MGDETSVVGASEDLLYKSKVFAALIEAQKAIQSVEKGSENKFHRYRYASAEALMAEGREALLSSGLALVMTGWRLEPSDSREIVGKDGENFTVYPHTVTAEFALVHAAGAVYFAASYPTVPERGRPEDKACATALTYLEGYVIRGLLCLPRVDASEEVDQRDDRERQTRARAGKDRKFRPPEKERPRGSLPLDKRGDPVQRFAKGLEVLSNRFGLSRADVAERLGVEPKDLSTNHIPKMEELFRALEQEARELDPA